MCGYVGMKLYNRFVKQPSEKLQLLWSALTTCVLKDQHHLFKSILENGLKKSIEDCLMLVMKLTLFIAIEVAECYTDLQVI